MIYPPQEDSLLLKKWVKKLSYGKVLDMGTGSGIQAHTASGNKTVKSVLAVDINPEVINNCRRNIANKKIRCLRSDLFSKVPMKQFDTIIFNPPYLPQELKEKDIALEGGKKGHETLSNFLFQANAYLETDGMMLILFSSLTNKVKIEEILKQNLFVFKELDRLHIFFEDLFVYKVMKSPLLKKIENSGAKQLAYFTRGKRSWIYLGKYGSKYCAVKIKRPDSDVNSGTKEGKMLKIVNKLGLGPKLLVAKPNFVVYEFASGKYFETVLAESNKKQKKALFKQLFHQAFILDQAGLSKEEMLRPLRNAIVTSKGKVVLIDFERTHKTKKPHNVTQLCTFAMQKGIAPLKTLKHWAAHYKKNPTKANFKALLSAIGFK